ELLAELRPAGVTATRNIMQNKSGQRIKTATIILTFDTTTPPRELKAAYLKLKVLPYIPAPLRCYKCQKFRHSQVTCKNNLLCPKCSQAGHDSAACTETERCVNCQGNHPAFSTTCPVFQQEKAIAKIRAERSVGFPEARKLYEA